MRVTIETTADGSPTLYREDIDEHYHSVNGALAEGEHVYVETGWRPVTGTGETVTVFEVGFGSGLNAALTARAAMEVGCVTRYYCVELYPLAVDVAETLASGYSEELKALLAMVNDAPWGETVMITPWFYIHKIQADLLTMKIPGPVDVVYFDAFAPEKQPEMWDRTVFDKIYEAMKPGGVMTTYCAKGSVRRMLTSIGFTVERLPGPPGGKREILRATRPRL